MATEVLHNEKASREKIGTRAKNGGYEKAVFLRKNGFTARFCDICINSRYPTYVKLIIEWLVNVSLLILVLYRVLLLASVSYRMLYGEEKYVYVSMYLSFLRS